MSRVTSERENALAIHCSHYSERRKPLEISDDPAIFVRSLQRGLAVLGAFNGAPPELSLSQVAERTKLSPASVRRYLHTLESLGYLSSDKGLYRPLPRVLELAYPYFATSGLTRVMESELAALSERIQESCALTVLDGFEVTNVFCVNSSQTLSIQLRVGQRLPAYCTAMGRAILLDYDRATLEQFFSSSMRVKHTDRTLVDVKDLCQRMADVAELGYAIGDEEYEVGIRTVAVPIRGPRGHIISAASISTPAARGERRTLENEFADELKATVGRMEEHLSPSGGETGQASEARDT